MDKNRININALSNDVTTRFCIHMHGALCKGVCQWHDGNSEKQACQSCSHCAWLWL